MVIPRVYIDTSVIGGCFDKEFFEPSLALFQEFEKGIKIYVFSSMTIDELQNAPKFVSDKLYNLPDNCKEYLRVTNEIKELAVKYIEANAVTEKWMGDAMHIAIATIYKIDVLVSWNFKHIVNLQRIKQFNAVNLLNGYSTIEIRTPKEILAI
jgi:predicted nucleic acid-binding protein